MAQGDEWRDYFNEGYFPQDGEEFYGNPEYAYRGLGEAFYRDPEGVSGWDLNPIAPAWAYRVMRLDTPYGYRSPYGFSHDHASLGDVAVAGDDMMSQKGSAMPLVDRLYDNYRALRNPESDGVGYNLAGLVRGVRGDVGGWGKGGIVIDPFAGDRSKAVLWNGGPHRGFSVIGVPHGMYSILQRKDFEKWGDLARLAMDDFMKSPYYEEARERLGEDVDLSEDRPFISSPLMNAAYPYILRDVMLGLGGIIKQRELLESLRNRMIERQWLNGYMPSRDFFKDAEAGMGDYWKDFMHDSLVGALRDVLFDTSGGFGNPDANDYRLLQVAVPLSSLVKNDSVRAGADTAQRDDMNEYNALQYQPFNDVGGAIDLLGKSDSPLARYSELRHKGAHGDEAWHDALGERFGKIGYMVSDEDKKNVIGGLKEDIGACLQHRNIVSAIDRGPGNNG